MMRQTAIMLVALLVAAAPASAETYLSLTTRMTVGEAIYGDNDEWRYRGYTSFDGTGALDEKYFSVHGTVYEVAFLGWSVPTDDLDDGVYRFSTFMLAFYGDGNRDALIAPPPGLILVVDGREFRVSNADLKGEDGSGVLWFDPKPPLDWKVNQRVRVELKVPVENVPALPLTGAAALAGLLVAAARRRLRRR